MRTLGICWVVYGIYRLAVAAWLVVFTPTATLMFGVLLSRVPDPFGMMNAFHLLYLLVVFWSVICGFLGIAAGLSLLGGLRAAKSLAVAAAVFSLSEIPLGTTLGIYTLLQFLPTQGPEYDTATVQAVRA